MALIQWKQISPHFSGSGNFTGSLNITGSFFLNNLDILEQIGSSGIFSRTGSFYNTTNNVGITGSFSVKGDSTFSGSLIPQVQSAGIGVYDLGSATNPWRDLYLTTSSLKFVEGGSVVATVTGENNGIKIGNIRITTSSIDVVDNEGTKVQTVVSANIPESGNSTTEQIVSGSLSVSGSFFLNSTNILSLIGSSGIFSRTGSFYNTTNNVGITGSLIVDLDGSTDTFEVKRQGDTRVKVNEEGVLVFKRFETPPTPVTGSLFYSSSNDFYFGL